MNPTVILIYIFSGLGKIIGVITGTIISSPINKALRVFRSGYYTGLYCKRFKYFGKKSQIFKMEAYCNLKNITVGNNTTIEKGALLRCFTNGKTGEICIGNNVNIGLNVNISSCNKIIIKDGTLLGRNVMINDNSHGNTKHRNDLLCNPYSRQIISKGPIIIEENVWIGENAVILSGVTVGHNSIIGANSVVTKNVSPFSIVGGVPSKIIKQYEEV